MTEVTYFVALPFVAADDGIAAGEPTECFNPTAVVMRAEAIAQAGTCWSRSIQPDGRSRNGKLRRCKGHQKIRRGAGRFKYVVEERKMKKGKEGSHLRQGNGQESVDQPAAQLVRLS